jgi:GMP synthase-like glutamine amidotransferase
MTDILIVRHVAHEGPGYLRSWLEGKGLSWRVVKIDHDEPVPARAGDYRGLVFMGGPMSVNDDLPWIAPALNLIRDALTNDIPVLGHCLGGQLIARAAGAAVSRNPVPEYGWLPVMRADNDGARDWLGALPERFDAFHWHGETFAIPADGTLVLSSEHCRNQAFVIGTSLALQCHVEMTTALVRDWVARADPDTLTPAPSIQSADTILDDLHRRVAELQSLADALYERWAQGLK